MIIKNKIFFKTLVIFSHKGSRCLKSKSKETLGIKRAVIMLPITELTCSVGSLTSSNILYCVIKWKLVYTLFELQNKDWYLKHLWWMFIIFFYQVISVGVFLLSKPSKHPAAPWSPSGAAEVLPVVHVPWSWVINLSTNWTNSTWLVTSPSGNTGKEKMTSNRSMPHVPWTQHRRLLY